MEEKRLPGKGRLAENQNIQVMKVIKNHLTGTIYGNITLSVIRIIAGMLFIYSGIFKVIDPLSFERVIIRYNVLPEIMVPFITLIIPYLELLCGLFLAIGLRVKSTSFTLIILMIFFTTAIIINLIRGETFDCGCFELGRFGIAEEISISLVIRDIFFILVFFMLFKAKKHLLSMDTLFESEDLKNL